MEAAGFLVPISGFRMLRQRWPDSGNRCALRGGVGTKRDIATLTRRILDIPSRSQAPLLGHEQEILWCGRWHGDCDRNTDSDSDRDTLRC